MHASSGFQLGNKLCQSTASQPTNFLMSAMKYRCEEAAHPACCRGNDLACLFCIYILCCLLKSERFFCSTHAMQNIALHHPIVYHSWLLGWLAGCMHPQAHLMQFKCPPPTTIALKHKQIKTGCNLAACITLCYTSTMQWMGCCCCCYLFATPL